MRNIEIIASGKYIPKTIIKNEDLEKKYNVEDGYIIKRTGIKQRFYAHEEIEELAIKAVKQIANNKNKNFIQKVDLIIVASTTQKSQMPSVSYEVQKFFNIENCMCIDILAGCAGFINALDISKLYIDIGKINTALVIGVEKLSSYVDKNDIGTEILFSDGAGAILINATEEEKKYCSLIESKGQKGEILKYTNATPIFMDGKEVYKYAVTDTVKNINKLLEKNNIKKEEIKYIVPHQSNKKILQSMSNRLKIDQNKMYSNIENYGNTFCASIPIALDDLFKKKMIEKNDKILLVGYGGGLNTGSILLEI